LSLLSGKETLKKDLIDDAARSLIRKGRCEVIVVSMGEKGGYLATSSLSEHVRAPKVEKLSTVGAGDCMVGGMVHALVKGKDLREMLRMGIACGTAATMNPGTELFKRKDAENLYNLLMKEYK
jgi:6-phosphofructokinase 2